MSTEQKPSEKGNVARIVNRLSKDFGAGTGSGGGNSVPSVLANRTENVPLRNRVASNNAAQIGWIDPIAAPTPAAARETAIVRFSYAAQQPDELDLKEGDELLVLEQVEDGWARGELLSTASQPARRGRIGLYPTNFVSTVAPTPATQTAPLSTISAGNTSTFPRAVDTGHKEKHQKEESLTELLSPTAPKSPGTLISNGSNEETGTSPAILHSNNVLPSSLLRTTGGAGSLGPSAGANTRRVMSTLISGTSAVGEQQQQAVQPMGQQNKAKEFAKVLYKYDAAAPDELSLPEGAIVAVLNRQCEDEGWFVAELDGRRGLFPDNFVKFLPSEPAQPFHTLGTAQQPPPSLPAKPQKFQPQQLVQNPPPVANTRDSLSALLFNNSSSATNSPDTAHPPAPTMDKLMSASTTTVVDADTENNNNNGGGGISSASLLGTKHLNTAGNRLSQKIQILQKNLEQGGGIPIGPRPPKEKEMAQNVPKETDKNIEIQQADPAEPKPVLLVAEHVKARAQIGKPQNRRPPSKVNSAALLAADSNENDDNLGGNNTAFNNNHTTIKPHPPSHSPSPSPTRQKPGKKEAEKSIPTATGKSTVFSSQAPQSPVDAKPLLCSINEETNISAGQHKSTPLFQCPPNLPPPNPAHQQPHHLPKAAHSPASSADTSPSQWVSRAEFERFAEDCQRKFAEMQAELRELRDRVEKAENK